jgi:peptidoglycan/LPS O-acetylase OafA/YrhL
MTYRPSLDGIRGIAVILVVLLHVQFLSIRTPCFGLVKLFRRFPWVAIYFFVLSGFLITGLVMHEHEQTGTISLKSFYLRRVLRLIPALVLLLLVTILYAAVFLSSEIRHQTITVAELAILYVTNWAFAFHGCLDLIYWATCGVYLSRNNSICSGHGSRCIVHSKGIASHDD